MIRFDLDLDGGKDSRNNSDESVVDVRQPALGIVAAIDGDKSASTSASGA